MKKILAGAAAAAALIAPGVATADTNAVIGLEYSNTDFDFADADTYGFNGAFSHDLSNGALLQFDGAFDRTDVEGCCISGGYGAVHYATRNDNYAFGGFVTMQDLYIYSGLGLGVEGQMYFSNFVLGGSLSWVDFSDADLEVTTVAAEGSYFFTPNFALTGEASYSDADFGDWTGFGVGGEWRFASSPASVTFGYRNFDLDGDDVDQWRIGLNFDLGTGSVQERVTRGPGLNGAAATDRSIGILAP